MMRNINHPNSKERLSFTVNSIQVLIIFQLIFNFQLLINFSLCFPQYENNTVKYLTTYDISEDGHVWLKHFILTMRMSELNVTM
jgi:hypothetical protein